ncbi:MAG: HD domain-containing protein [Lentisphaeria bacterium]|nr:HD domain-containing protein [Lentisphaeria bacterium]
MPDGTSFIHELPLTGGLVQRLYDCASIQRWNDQVRPMEFTELDKQAHKMIIAYVLARFEDDDDPDNPIDWIKLLEGGIFELLHRVILTDIKPPVFHKMMEEKGDELNRWVLDNLKHEIGKVKGGFADRFERYLFDEAYSRREKRVLKAAHYLATQWEFNIIYKVCPFVYGIESIKGGIEDQIEDHYDLVGVQKISLGRKTSGFVDLCGQLRFQRRWSQSYRVPETSVLGHMLIVAFLSYLCMRELDACDRRVYNAFFGGLFHDLPEVLTRDITSPVKNAVEGLEEIIKEYERRQLEEKLLPLLPSHWRAELVYFTGDEFANRAVIDGKVRNDLTVEDLCGRYNTDGANAVDGETIRCCDHLAAFIEASLSIQSGLTSRHLEEGIERLLAQYRGRVTAGIPWGDLFNYYTPPGHQPELPNLV